jgi:hypothetical protein
MPLKPREFEAADKKTGMTLDEITELIESARAAGSLGGDVLVVTTTGFLNPRIKTARVVSAASK